MKLDSHLTPEILFEHDDYIVLNKPAGLMVHTDSRSIEPNLCDWLYEKYPSIINVGDCADGQLSQLKPDQTEASIEMDSNGPDESSQDEDVVVGRPGIVHRLDKDTSGVMVVAKTQQAFIHFKQEFHDRRVKKIYSALVWGNIKDERGIISTPIGRDASDFRKFSAALKARGEMRPATTQFKVVKKWKADEETEDSYAKTARKIGFALQCSLIDVFPKTGRTHQIRVHMRSINHPVVADKLYAETQTSLLRGFLGLQRQALHAKKITFTDLEGRERSFEASFPSDIEKALEMLNQDYCQI